MSEDAKLICQDCGKDAGVSVVYDPYALEINDEEIEIIVCESCLFDRAMDI